MSGGVNEEPVSDERQDTKEMRAIQARREAEEQEFADAATEPEETAQHERRAEKAQYLREKLERRAESEREVANEEEAD